jgi:hypothetical protein
MQINFGGHKLKMSPGEKTDNPHEYGGKIYTGIYDFNSHPTLTVNVGAPGTMGVMSGKQRPVENGNDVDAKLMSYDPDSDKFIFRAVNPAEATQVFKTETFIVPRSSLNVNDYNALPIMKDGKQVTIGDIVGKENSAKSGISWK